MGLTTSQHAAAVAAAVNAAVKTVPAKAWRGTPKAKPGTHDRIYLSRLGKDLGYLYLQDDRRWGLKVTGNPNYTPHAREAELAANALGPAPKEDAYAVESAAAVAHGGCGDCQGCMAGGPCDERGA